MWPIKHDIIHLRASAIRRRLYQTRDCTPADTELLLTAYFIEAGVTLSFDVHFEKGDACKLDFADETFDAVTSNYVYHNIVGKNKQELLRETLRVLKKRRHFCNP